MKCPCCATSHLSHGVTLDPKTPGLCHQCRADITETLARRARIQAATERDADDADEEELAAAASILTKGQR